MGGKLTRVGLREMDQCPDKHMQEQTRLGATSTLGCPCTTRWRQLSSQGRNLTCQALPPSQGNGIHGAHVGCL